eukprot:223134-Chlamydomonas_euryale.AAC.5
MFRIVATRDTALTCRASIAPRSGGSWQHAQQKEARACSGNAPLACARRTKAIGHCIDMPARRPRISIQARCPRISRPARCPRISRQAGLNIPPAIHVAICNANGSLSRCMGIVSLHPKPSVPICAMHVHPAHSDGITRQLQRAGPSRRATCPGAGPSTTHRDFAACRARNLSIQGLVGMG